MLKVLREARRLAYYWTRQAQRRRRPYITTYGDIADRRWWEGLRADRTYWDFGLSLWELSEEE